jgi:hypothetical protein
MQAARQVAITSLFTPSAGFPPALLHTLHDPAPSTPTPHPTPQAYANSLGVKVVGDMPIYVGGQSADVWANRHLFELDEKTCEPTEVGPAVHRGRGPAGRLCPHMDEGRRHDMEQAAAEQ